VPFFKPEQLKVFNELPADQKNTKIQESFVPVATKPKVPKSRAEWAKQRKAWMRNLRTKSFRGWPKQAQAGPLNVHRLFYFIRHGIEFSAFEFTSQLHVRLRLCLVHKTGLDWSESVTLNVLDERGWPNWLGRMGIRLDDVLSDLELPDLNNHVFKGIRKRLIKSNQVLAYIAPRGVGLDAWNKDKRKRIQIRRRFMLLGQTVDGMRVWDVRRAIQALRTLESIKEAPVTLRGNGKMAGIALYASLFEPGITELYLSHLPNTHRDGPTFLNVMRYLDMPQAVAMAAERSQVCLFQENDSGWHFPKYVAERFDWPEDKLRIYDESDLYFDIPYENSIY
jgi:hypothetical protein